jgi:uncharacterized protein (DUF2252 family)
VRTETICITLLPVKHRVPRACRASTLEKKAYRHLSRFANVVGQSHGRQMKSDVRAGWRKDLKTFHSKTIDAPSWLWKSVVDLVGIHEASYLEHCRKFALSEAASLKF